MDTVKIRILWIRMEMIKFCNVRVRVIDVKVQLKFRKSLTALPEVPGQHLSVINKQQRHNKEQRCRLFLAYATVWQRYALCILTRFFFFVTI